MGYRRAFFFAAILILFALAAAAGKTIDSPSESMPSQDGARFTQTIEWERIDFAGGYRLEVTDSKGAVVFDGKGPENSRELRLASGSYKYRITVYNLLGNPDAVGNWIQFAVRKAVAPRILSVSPTVLRLDDKPVSVSVFGENVSDETEFELVGSGNGHSPVALGRGVPKTDGTFELELPAESCVPGSYILRATNPGGLSFDASDTIKISYRSPVSLSITAGWNAYVPIADKWYSDIWDGGLYPLGGSLHVSASTRAGKKSAIGARASASFNRADTSSEGMSVLTDIRRLDAEAFVGTKLGSRFFVSVGAGAGAVWTFLSMTRDSSVPDGGIAIDASAIEIAAIKPSVNAFAEAQCLLWDHLVLSCGLDVVDTLSDGKHLVFASPNFSAGWSF